MFNIKLENFGGPLDLLLYFIKRDKIDIYDIPITQITNEYIAVIDEANPDVFMAIDVSKQYSVKFWGQFVGRQRGQQALDLIRWLRKHIFLCRFCVMNAAVVALF